MPLDSGFQAKFSPAVSGPYTFQCGKETKTVAVSLPQQKDSRAYSSGENLFLVAGAAIVFLAALFLAAKVFLKPRTIFSKSVGYGRVRLFLRAGEEMHGIKINDPQCGENGGPLELSIPHLRCGAAWSWEYEGSIGEPLLAARLSVKCAKGEISLLSGVGGGNTQKAAEENKHEKRKLAKHRC